MNHVLNYVGKDVAFIAGMLDRLPVSYEFWEKVKPGDSVLIHRLWTDGYGFGFTKDQMYCRVDSVFLSLDDVYRLSLTETEYSYEKRKARFD